MSGRDHFKQRKLTGMIFLIEHSDEDALFQELGRELDHAKIVFFSTKMPTEGRLNFPTEDECISGGKPYFLRVIDELRNKICVEADACSWEKDVLGDAKTLFQFLLPIVGSVTGYAIEFTAIPLAAIVIKYGIRRFCDCLSE